MSETEQTFAQIPQLSHFNPIELSLIHLSHFPTLVSPGVTTSTKARSSSVSSPPLTPTQALVSPSSSTLSTSHPVLAGASPAAASADALSNGSRLSFILFPLFYARVVRAVFLTHRPLLGQCSRPFDHAGRACERVFAPRPGVQGQARDFPARVRPPLLTSCTVALFSSAHVPVSIAG